MTPPEMSEGPPADVSVPMRTEFPPSYDATTNGSKDNVKNHLTKNAFSIFDLCTMVYAFLYHHI